jgi:hypothetical protein
MLLTPGNLHRVLECEEEAGAGALFGLHLQQVFAVEQHRALGDLVARTAREDMAQRALARNRWAP